MRPTLTRTLFTSFLALTLLVLVATLGLARWSFERGFYEYVRTLERYRLEIVAGELVELTRIEFRMLRRMLSTPGWY